MVEEEEYFKGSWCEQDTLRLALEDGEFVVTVCEDRGEREEECTIVLTTATVEAVHAYITRYLERFNEDT